MIQRLLPLLALLILSLPAWALEAAPKVVVSIKPVHSLVAGVMQGVADPELLIRGSQSPHDFSLRPSDMRKLQQADLVIWVGPNVESSLSTLFAKNQLDAGVVALTRMQGIDWLHPRDDAEWEARMHKHAETADHGHDEPHGIDSHIWLSPAVARHIVEYVAELLIDLDKPHADSYRHNAGQLIERLDRLDSRLESMLAPVKGVPYVVFHDAYHYFEEQYGLNAVGSVSVSPDRQPGIRHIQELRSKITRLQARCVFSEPQFRPKLIATLIEGTDARVGQLDPLGTDLTAGTDAYFELMQRLADNLLQCLQ